MGARKGREIMEEKRCYGCMKPIPVDADCCPHCGYDNRTKNELHQLPAGTVLKEQYLIGKVLGQGGFGITYMGWDLYLEIPVAIKEYFPSGAVSRNSKESTDVISGSGEVGARFRNSRERFMREVKMLARMSDIPEIVHVKTFFLANNTAYIVMEYIKGVTLKDYVKTKGGRLTLAEALQILDPIMGALEKVHKAGLVHRDISPDNIMLLDNGTAKLLDFGAVRDVGLADPDQPITKSTEAILKQGYAPVEQYQGKGALGPWTDVYAMCATLYYCLTGSIPADAPGRVLGEEITWFGELGVSVPDGLEDLLKEGMEIRTRDRIQDMATLRKRLAELPQQEPEPKPNPIPPRPDPVPTPDRRKWIGAIAALALVAVGGLAWGVSQNHSDTPTQTEGREASGLADTEASAAETAEQPETDTMGVAGVTDTEAAETETQSAVSPQSVPVEELVGENAVSWESNGTICYLNPDTGVFAITPATDRDGYMQTYQGDTEAFDGAQIAPWLEEYRDAITKVVIYDGVNYIGNCSFMDCPNLTEVEGLEYVEQIGCDAFTGCGLQALAFGQSRLREIEERAFQGCPLTEVTIPSGAERVDMNAFSRTALEKLIFTDDPMLTNRYGDFEAPEHLTVYGRSGGSVEAYCRDHGLTFVSTGECGYALSGTCGPDMYYELDRDTGVLTLTADRPGTAMFGWGSMADVPWGGLRYLIRKVVITENVATVGAFTNCENLTEVEGWESVRQIGSYAFLNTGLKKVILPEGVVTIATQAFDNCRNLEEVEIPASVQHLGWAAFGYCYSSKITIKGNPYVSDSLFCDQVYGLTGSHAEAFCQSNWIPFESIGDVSELPAPVYSGKCGDDVQWSFDQETGVLTLSGSGSTWDYRGEWWMNEVEPGFEWPEWHPISADIQKVVVEPGITRLGQCLFNYCEHATELECSPDIELGSGVFDMSGLSL